MSVLASEEKGNSGVVLWYRDVGVFVWVSCGTLREVN